MKFGDSFLFKELVNTYEYTTATQDRDVCTYVSINGRRYTKFGTLQAVTFVGNLYKINDDRNSHKYVLAIGMSRQHPCDTKINKEVGYEVANINAMTNPIMLIELNGSINYGRFKNIVTHYLSSMKLEFIKTRAEIIADGGNPVKYNR